MSDPQTEANASATSDASLHLPQPYAEEADVRVDADMKHVLDVLDELGVRPLEYTTPALARRQPGPAEAIAAILARQHRSPAEDGVESQDISIPIGESGELPARLYRPVGLLSRLNPVVLYFHGGGFVTGDLDSHDVSARALARRTGAIVVSVAYRLAPEHRFPAAHEDAYAAWTWLLAQVHELTGDPRRLAVVGEDAGANLAVNVAIRARDEHVTQPLHQVLIHPIAGSELKTPSYEQAHKARPVGQAAMRWRFRHLFENDDQINDGRIDLLSRSDLAGLAPATLVLAGIDPLRSEGEAFAQALGHAGVPVNCWIYEGVTQGFFGLGLIVTKALFAQTDVAQALSKAFATGRHG